MAKKKEFTKKTAREIAQRNFEYVLDSIFGITDPDYTLSTSAEWFEDNFAEDLEERNIRVTEHRIGVISSFFNERLEKVKEKLNREYEPKKIIAKNNIE